MDSLISSEIQKMTNWPKEIFLLCSKIWMWSDMFIVYDLIKPLPVSIKYPQEM